MTAYRCRPNPCSTCPYRKRVPSGVWAPQEYERLRKFDGEIADQARAGAVKVFLCHCTAGCLCAGWVGHREDPADLLAIRLGLAEHAHDPGTGVHPSVLDYRTDVELWPTGAAAAEHGLHDVDAPDDRAHAAIAKLIAQNPSLVLPAQEPPCPTTTDPPPTPQATPPPSS